MADLNNVISKVQSTFGNEVQGDDTLFLEQMMEPCMGDVLSDLIDANSKKINKFRKSLTSQSWSSSEFSAPTDMFYNKAKFAMNMYIGGNPVYFLEDRHKLKDISGFTRTKHYCAFKGGDKFDILHASGTSSGSDLDIDYFRTPAIADFDEELEGMLIVKLTEKLSMRKSGSQIERVELVNG